MCQTHYVLVLQSFMPMFHEKEHEYVYGFVKNLFSFEQKFREGKK